MTEKYLKKLIREAYTEVLAEKDSEKKPVAVKKETPKVSKKDLDQTKDDTIDAGDAVVASKKEKIALSKGDKEGAAFYKKIKSIVNKRKGSKI
jgi:hypothetical protein